MDRMGWEWRNANACICLMPTLHAYPENEEKSKGGRYSFPLNSGFYLTWAGTGASGGWHVCVVMDV